MQTLLTKAQDKLRSLYCIDKGLINFASNDYLSLAQSSLARDFLRGNEGLALAGISSRLLGASAQASGDLEELAFRMFGKSALVFNSGFLANYSCLQALAALEKPLFIADKSIHASCIDAIRQHNFKRFAHNDYEHLKRLLQINHKEHKNIIILSEALFSMDGDCVDLEQLVRLKDEFNQQSCRVWLYIDEAHSIGCLGDNGFGLVASSKYAKKVDFCLLTFSKALSSVGAIMLSDEVAKQVFINYARGLIYSTSLPELNIAYNHFVLSKLAEFEPERIKLRANCELLNSLLNELGVKYLGDLYIKLIVLGSANKALAASAALKQLGFFAPAIRPPTVAMHLSGLRLSINAAHTKEQLQKLAFFLRNLCESL